MKEQSYLSKDIPMKSDPKNQEFRVSDRADTLGKLRAIQFQFSERIIGNRCAAIRKNRGYKPLPQE